MVSPIANRTAAAHHAGHHNRLSGVASLMASRQAQQGQSSSRPETSRATVHGDNDIGQKQRAAAFNARQSIEAIGAALNSGDQAALKAAVEAFRSGGKAPTAAPSDGSEVAAVGPGHGQGRSRRLAAIGQALEAGDLEAARKAFAGLAVHRGEGRHNHHRTEKASGIPAQTPPAPANTADAEVQTPVSPPVSVPSGASAAGQETAAQANSTAVPAASAGEPAKAGETPRKRPLAALGEALASGDLEAAKKAFADLVAQRAERRHHHHDHGHTSTSAPVTTVPQQAAGTGSSAASSTEASATTGRPSEMPHARLHFGRQMKAIREALEAGDLEAASKAFAELVAHRFAPPADAVPTTNTAPAADAAVVRDANGQVPAAAPGPVTPIASPSSAAAEATGSAAVAGATSIQAADNTGETVGTNLASATSETASAKPLSPPETSGEPAAPVSPPSAPATPMDALSAALKAGDLDAARSAFADLVAQRESRHHRHERHEHRHHHGHHHGDGHLLQDGHRWSTHRHHAESPTAAMPPAATASTELTALPQTEAGSAA